MVKKIKAATPSVIPRSIPFSNTRKFEKPEPTKPFILRARYQELKKTSLEFMKNNNPLYKMLSEDQIRDFEKEILEKDSYSENLFNKIETLNKEITNLTKDTKLNPEVRKLLKVSQELLNSDPRKKNDSYSTETSYRRAHTFKTVEKIEKLLRPEAKEPSPQEKEDIETFSLTSVLADVAQDYASRILFMLKNKDKGEALSSYLTLAKTKDEDVIVAVLMQFAEKKMTEFFARNGQLSEENMKNSRKWTENFLRMLLKKILEKKLVIAADLDDDEEEDDKLGLSQWLIFVIMGLLCTGSTFREIYRNQYQQVEVPNSFKIDSVVNEFGIEIPYGPSAPEDQAFQYALTFFNDCMYPSYREPKETKIESELIECMKIADNIIFETKGFHFFKQNELSDEEFMKDDIGYKPTTPDPRENYSARDLNLTRMITYSHLATLNSNEDLEQLACQSFVSLGEEGIVTGAKRVPDKNEGNKYAVSKASDYKNFLKFTQTKEYFGIQLLTLGTSFFSATGNIFIFGPGFVVPNWQIAIHAVNGALWLGPPIAQGTIDMISSLLGQEKEGEGEISTRELMERFKPNLKYANEFGFEKVGEDKYKYVFLNQEIEERVIEILNAHERDQADSYNKYGEGRDIIAKVFRNQLVRHIVAAEGNGINVNDIIREQRINYLTQKIFLSAGFNSKMHPYMDISSRIFTGSPKIQMDWRKYFVETTLATMDPITSNFVSSSGELYTSFVNFFYPELIKTSFILDPSTIIGELGSIMELAYQTYFFMVLLVNTLGLVNSGARRLTQGTFLDGIRRFLLQSSRTSISTFCHIWSFSISFRANVWVFSRLSSLWILARPEAFSMSIGGFGVWGTVGAVLAAVGGNVAVPFLARSILKVIPSTKKSPAESSILYLREAASNFFFTTFLPASMSSSLITGKKVELGILRELRKFIRKTYDEIKLNRKEDPEIEMNKKIRTWLKKRNGQIENLDLTTQYIERFFNPDLNYGIEIKPSKPYFKEYIAVLTLILCAESRILPSDMTEINDDDDQNPGGFIENWITRVRYRSREEHLSMLQVQGITKAEKRNIIDVNVDFLRSLFENLPAVDAMGWLSWKSSNQKRFTLSKIATILILTNYTVSKFLPDVLPGPMDSFITQYNRYVLTKEQTEIQLPQIIRNIEQGYTPKFIYDFYDYISGWFVPTTYLNQPWEMNPYVRSLTVWVPQDTLSFSKIRERILQAIDDENFNSDDFLIELSKNLRVENFYNRKKKRNNRFDTSEMNRNWNLFIESTFDPSRTLKEVSTDTFSTIKHFIPFSFSNTQEPVREFKKMMFSVDLEKYEQDKKNKLTAVLNQRLNQQKLAFQKLIVWIEKNPNANLFAADDRFYFDATLLGYFKEIGKPLPQDFNSRSVVEKDDFYRENYQKSDFTKVLKIFFQRTR